MHAQAPEGPEPAKTPQTIPHPLYPYREFMAECDRTLVPAFDTEPRSERCVQKRRQFSRRYRSLRRPPQCESDVLRVDEER